MSLTVLTRRSGCLVCGAPLAYLAEARAMTCAGCGAVLPSAAACIAGHFVCDVCHGASPKDVVERVCCEAEGTDPLAIARTAMHQPGLAMHGPEHHFLVPAALLAAHANARGTPGERARLVAEARRRSDPVLGGFCGYQGACGAAIGAGIYVSVATGATPVSHDSRALANRATSIALGVLAGVGGPRCCKRDSWLVLLSAVKFARQHLGVALRSSRLACDFTSLNAECLGARCPFHPRDET
jgi:hypothetical protein